MRYVATHTDSNGVESFASGNERGHVIRAAIEVYTSESYGGSPIIVVLDTRTGEIIFRIGAS